MTRRQEGGGLRLGLLAILAALGSASAISWNDLVSRRLSDTEIATAAGEIVARLPTFTLETTKKDIGEVNKYLTSQKYTAKQLVPGETYKYGDTTFEYDTWQNVDDKAVIQGTDIRVGIDEPAFELVSSYSDGGKRRKTLRRKK